MNGEVVVPRRTGNNEHGDLNWAKNNIANTKKASSVNDPLCAERSPKYRIVQTSRFSTE